MIQIVDAFFEGRSRNGKIFYFILNLILKFFSFTIIGMTTELYTVIYYNIFLEKKN